MTRKCSVPGCRSNYNGTSDHVTTFKFPSDKAVCEKWIKFINMKDFNQRKNSNVCMKHFESHFIIFVDSVTRDDGSILTVKRKYPGLKKGAYPTILPDEPFETPQNLRKNPIRWTDALISQLIQLKFEKREEFKQGGKRGSTHDVWMSIIRELHLENQLTVLSVRKKWNSLLHKFKDIENKIAVGSWSEDLSWPHYNQMQTIMNEISSQENPAILATGGNNETVKIQFSDSVHNDGIENEEDMLEQRSSKREKRDIIDERFISAIEEGNELLKSLHTTLDKQGEAFLQLMNRLVNAVENQVPDDASM